MTSLEKTLKCFSSKFGRSGTDLGKVDFYDQSITLSSNLLLGVELSKFYEHLKFERLTIGGEFSQSLFGINQIEQCQIGWRFSVTPSGGKTIYPDWPEEWIVFGDRSGDGIVADTKNENSPIFGSIQQKRNIKLASSLENYLLILIDCMICEEEEFGFETQDDDFIQLPEFLNRVSEIVNNHENELASNWLSFFFG